MSSAFISLWRPAGGLTSMLNSLRLRPVLSLKVGAVATKAASYNRLHRAHWLA